MAVLVSLLFIHLFYMLIFNKVGFHCIRLVIILVVEYYFDLHYTKILKSEIQNII